MNKFLLIIFLLASCSTSPKKDEMSYNKIDSLVQETTIKKSISDPNNTLTGKIQTLELSYIVWGCACANWVTQSDFEKYQGDSLAEKCIFIEPENQSLELPLYFDAARHRIKLKGQFYSKPDYPKGTIQSEEQLDKAKVFRYSEIEVKKNQFEYLQKDDSILILTFNAIECACPQWSETKFLNKTDREFYYLERANEKLINADSLWKGENLPLEIKLTGQIISTSGYPTGYNPNKGQSKSGNVFRYTKIEVLKNGAKNRNGY